MNAAIADPNNANIYSVEISDGTTILRYIDSSTMLVLGGNTYVSAPLRVLLTAGNIHTHPVVIGRNDALESFLDANVSTTGDLTMKIQIWNQTGILLAEANVFIDIVTRTNQSTLIACAVNRELQEPFPRDILNDYGFTL